MNNFQTFVNSIEPTEVKFDDFEMLEELTQMKIDLPQIKTFFGESK